MRASSVLSLLAAAGGAAAQLSLPSSIGPLPFSPACQQAVLGVLTNGSFSQCFHVADLLPLFTSNGSIVPVLDQFMSDLCYDGSSVCTNETLNMAAASVYQGCASDLMMGGLPNSTVSIAFAQYPLVREVLCLKTQDPYTSASYGGVLGPAPIPINGMTYNSTNGTFCVTSLLTQLSAYMGANLTVPYITSIATGTNTTALGLVKSINANVACNECIFAAVDLIETAYPMLGNVSLSTIGAYLNMSLPNVTVNMALDGECQYIPLVVNSMGMLPSNISVSIVNSTFPYNVTNGNMSMMA